MVYKRLEKMGVLSLLFLFILNLILPSVRAAESTPTREELTRYAILKSQLPIGAGLPSVITMLKSMAKTNKMADDAWNNSDEGKKINEALKNLIDVDGICHFVEGGEKWIKGINDGLIGWLKGTDKFGDIKNPHHSRDFEFEKRLIEMIRKENVNGGIFAVFYLTDWQYIVYEPSDVQISNGVYRRSKIEFVFDSVVGNFILKDDTYRICHFLYNSFDGTDYGNPDKYGVNNTKSSVLVYTNGDYYNNDIKVENIYNTTTNFEGNTYYTISDDVKTFDDIDKKSPQEVLKKSVDKPVSKDTSGWGVLDFLKAIWDFISGLVGSIADIIGKLVGLLVDGIKSLFIPKQNFSIISDTLSKKISLPNLQLKTDFKSVPFVHEFKFNQGTKLAFAIPVNLNGSYFVVIRKYLNAFVLFAFAFFCVKKVSSLFGGDSE